MKMMKERVFSLFFFSCLAYQSVFLFCFFLAVEVNLLHCLFQNLPVDLFSSPARPNATVHRQ